LNRRRGRTKAKKGAGHKRSPTIRSQRSPDALRWFKRVRLKKGEGGREGRPQVFVRTRNAYGSRTTVIRTRAAVRTAGQKGGRGYSRRGARGRKKRYIPKVCRSLISGGLESAGGCLGGEDESKKTKTSKKKRGGQLRPGHQIPDCCAGEKNKGRKGEEKSQKVSIRGGLSAPTSRPTWRGKRPLRRLKNLGGLPSRGDNK